MTDKSAEVLKMFKKAETHEDLHKRMLDKVAEGTYPQSHDELLKGVGGRTDSQGKVTPPESTYIPYKQRQQEAAERAAHPGWNDLEILAGRQFK